jgi:hypothetical protein
MNVVRFNGHIRYWNPEKPGGLAVADIPAEHVHAFGGLKQQRVRGSVSGVEFASNVMPAGAGRLAVSVSKAMMKAAGSVSATTSNSQSMRSGATDPSRPPGYRGAPAGE